MTGFGQSEGQKGRPMFGRERLMADDDDEDNQSYGTSGTLRIVKSATLMSMHK